MEDIRFGGGFVGCLIYAQFWSTSKSSALHRAMFVYVPYGYTIDVEWDKVLNIGWSEKVIFELREEIEDAEECLKSKMKRRKDAI